MSLALDRFLEQYAFRHPVPGTRAGIRLHDHELPGWSREAREDELDEFEALTVALDEEHEETADDVTLATDRHALEVRMARSCMDVRQLAFESGFFEDRNPRLWIDEALDGIRSVIERPPSDGARDDTMDDVASIAMRLHEVPRFFDDLGTTMTTGTPAMWQASGLQAASQLRETLPALVNGWLTRRAVDQESATWVREALGTALMAIDAATATMDALAEAEEDSARFGSEATEALLSRGCFITSEVATLLERARHECDTLQAYPVDVPDPDGMAQAPAPPLPAPALHTANRLGRLAAVARPTLVDALPGAWLADAWSVYLSTFCDAEGDPITADPETLPEALVHRRLMQAACALVDLQWHTHGISVDEAIAFLQETLGVSRRTADLMLREISMAPCRAVHAWFGAHALHQTRHVLLGRGVADSATFTVRAMAFGAIPAPLLSRLLLAT